MPSKPKKKIAILIESTRSYARDLIMGIARFQSEYRHWEIEYSPRGFDEPLPEWLKNWKGDGVIARIDNRRLLRLLLAKRVPIVDLRRFIKHPSVPQIGPDDRRAVEMVFDLFRKRYFEHFAFVGPAAKEHPIMDVRFHHFRTFVRKQGFDLTEIRPGRSPDGKPHAEAAFRRELKKLPARTAILAANDDWGMRTLEACRFLERPVPYDLIVAGIGNDRCLCELALPKLTSVDLNPQHIGYLAATMLQKMMGRSYQAPRESFVEPLVIVERASTDMISTEDPYVREAVRFIRSNIDKKIVIRDVVKHVHLSRVALENRFKRVTGHSVFQELLQTKVEIIKERLVRGDVSVKYIALETGFADPMYMMRLFRKHTGMTMGQYRKKFRKEPPD